MRTVIQRQDFQGPNNSFNADSALILDCRFTETLMQGARQYDATFIRCQFQDVSLYWANLCTTVFVECSFADVEFRGANMGDCLFLRCTLARCDFTRDNLGGSTDLTTVTFTDTERTDCRYEPAGSPPG